MPIREFDDADDEDWYDDDSEDAEDGSTLCPECGETVYRVADKCPACGYWLSDADREAMWAGERKPMWVTPTAVVLLVLLLLSIAIGVF